MSNSTQHAILSLHKVSQRFGSVVALRDINISIEPGRVYCLLGDNGAGKSTLIKLLSGVYQPSEGELLVDDQVKQFNSPRDALDSGIATVYQDLALIPLMSIGRNFVLGQEPTTSFGPLRFFDSRSANRIAVKSMSELGIKVRNANHAVANLSGGEKQCLAIARAMHFGARVLILDEPTAALGVKQTAEVLKVIRNAKNKGIAIIFITHNIHHAFPVADQFILLNKGECIGIHEQQEVSKEQIFDAMSGRQELLALEDQFDE